MSCLYTHTIVYYEIKKAVQAVEISLLKVSDGQFHDIYGARRKMIKQQMKLILVRNTFSMTRS